MKEKMRKFKFRVYDTIRKMFVTEHRSNSGLISISIDGTINYEYGTWNSDHLVIQQYTGINDKNGKEIYEGDILDMGYDIQGKRVLTSVEFNQENYGEVLGFNLMNFPDGRAYEYYYGESPSSRKEVVGNIFEGIHNESQSN